MPKKMSDEVVDAILTRIKSHCQKHNTETFRIIFHGGEPLLTGMNFYENFVKVAEEKFKETGIILRYSLQTNGLLLNEEWCDLFARLNISFGISLDGTKEANDKYRVDHQGKGTHSRAVKGLKIAQNSESLKSLQRSPGILSVINTSIDPIEIYEHYKELQVKRISFLFPDNTYDDPPHELANGDLSIRRSQTPFADWLIAIFDQWFYETDSKPRISLFYYIIHIIFGEDITSDLFGTDDLEVLSIETDGSIEANPTFSICGNGFTKTGINVLTNELDEAFQTELAAMYYGSKSRLCKQCNGCPINDICGGGFAPHRYMKSKGFNNPSIYCSDLLKLITHIQNKVLMEFSDSRLEQMGVAPLTFEEAKEIIISKMEYLEEPDYASELEEFSVITK